MIASNPEGTLQQSGFPIATWGDEDNPIAVTEVAVSDTHLVVAGTYSGTPVPAWEGRVSGFVSGDQGDAFVMAFDFQTPWTNTTPPAWFKRIRSDGSSNVDATVDALVADSGAIWVTGQMAATGGIDDQIGCFTSPPLEGGRAYLAQLDQVTGEVQYVRFDGFDIGGVSGYQRARGTALVRLQTPSRLVSAVSSVGDIKLDCLGSTTAQAEAPLSHIRVDNF